MKPRKPRDLPPELGRLVRGLRSSGALTIAKRVQRRECGDCQACCVVKIIKAIDKPAHCDCLHQVVGVGCEIYSGRPSECSGYYCAWRMGCGTEDAQPHRIGGVVVDLEKNPGVAAKSGADPNSYRSMVGVVRSAKPFQPVPVMRTIQDLRDLGVQFFATADPAVGQGERLVFARKPRGVRFMVESFAKTGRAPWNQDKAPYLAFLE